MSDERHQPVAQRESPESQALLLGDQVEVLGAELQLELALEIVEEVVPAHAAKLPSDHLPTRSVIHSPGQVLDTRIHRVLRWSTPEVWGRFDSRNQTSFRGQPMGTATPLGGSIDAASAPDEFEYRPSFPRIDGTIVRAIRPKFTSEDFFGHQPSPTSALPDPRPLLENLTRCVIEILAGARELEQVARWVSDDVYRHLLKRVVIATRARQAKGQPIARPNVLDRLAHDLRAARRRDRGRRDRSRTRPRPRGRAPARGTRPPLAGDRDQRAVSCRPSPGP